MGVSTGGSQDKKDLNVDINLMPVFDVLSVCICFLLMTVVWIQVASVQTSQGMGGQSAAETKVKPSIWLTINERNDVEIALKSDLSTKKSVNIKSVNGVVNWEMAKRQVKGLFNASYETAMILPAKQTKYDQVIQFMVLFKEMGIKDVGISPI